MEQTRALNALEPFVLLSKTASSPRAATDLITQATSAANTYVFAELLESPNIQALRNASPEYSRYLTLLEIFAWGTWSDYSSTPGLPELSEPQAHKLRQLSLLPLSASHSTLTYAHLQDALSLPTVRALEDLIISAVYAGLLHCKLDTMSRRVDVSSVAPLRDLRPKNVPAMIDVLDDWDSRCVNVLADIESQIRDVRQRTADRRRREQTIENMLDRTAMQDKGGKRAAVEDGEKGDGLNNDQMDLDDQFVRMPRSAKRGGHFYGPGRRLG
ncbi:hypothetical protein L228DRAFT_268606 [Xylona heveae TC161]|uniref:PCI domain-containing protein n=1 Tax=Xylona heveae (strain CBS 132557 / TC161) TaxID=1328760 RepID=A0A165GF64_XYLHT|nr:hypothetical protein L228DRAFT_268606 [Xylona heveae TC161]KZF22113.1 hypothetical protein L228DRAFT_268606 [Xylona heveae TC161]